jgi:O-antigen ligase
MLAFLKTVFLFSTAFTLIIKHIYAAGPLVIALAGFSCRRRAVVAAPVIDHDLVASWRALLSGFAAFALTTAALSLYHAEPGFGTYERILPFILLPPLAWTIRAGSWSPEIWLLAVGASCLMALGIGIHDITVGALIRAHGATSNPISFGNLNVVFGMICAIASVTFPFQNRTRLYRSFLVLSALAAAVASLLSGSKGGWLSLLLVAFVAGALIVHDRPLWQRLLAPISVLALITTLAFLAPSMVVRDRLASGINGAVTWFQTGEVKEFSVSVRFELWALGWHIFKESPFVGQGAEGRAVRWTELTHSGQFYPGLDQFTAVDSELVGVLAEGGLIGACGYYLTYVGAFLAFWRWRRDPDMHTRSLATMGIMLVPVHLLFGLSVSVFGISMFRTIYVTLTVTLLAFITVRRAQLQEAASKGTGEATRTE